MDNEIVYEIIFDYSTNDNSWVDTYIFDSYEKAFEKFNSIIEKEKENTYWIKDAFKKDNSLKDYEFETNINESDECLELYWNITDKYNWYNHLFLNLKIKEIE